MCLLHKMKNYKKNNDPLIRLITQMIAGILACVFCLVSMTWAWFTASINTGMQTIQSATRSTSVMVYEVSQSEDENSKITKTLIKPEISKTTDAVSLDEAMQTTEKDESVIIAGESVIWELSPEKSYEVVMTGSGTASIGYCKVALSYTVNGSNTAETQLYTTPAFEKDNTVKFTYNTGGFSNKDGVTETQYKEYVEKTTPPTLSIASYWGKPATDVTSQVSLMSLDNTSEEEIMLLSNGDVLGLAPIPCPAAKAKTEVELEGFEIQDGAEISAEEDYKVSLTLKEGYEMPSEVVVNIDGKDYVVSTEGVEASDDAPYYNVETGVLTVPSALLSDGIKVSVKATANPIPEEEPKEEENEEEVTEESTEETLEEKADETTKEITDNTTEETSKETTDKTETTDNNKSEEDNSVDTSSGNNVVADNPNKKEEDGEKDSDEPVKTPAGDGGNDDDVDDKADNNSGGLSSGDTSPSDNNEIETEVEKADVTLNLSQLTINLEETRIPTNADLVLTLSAKEDMKFPEQIVITLDKTIRDEDIDNEEITEDKTEYIINTDGENNPEGFEFDTETGELTISSELLKAVREITVADTENDKATEDDEKPTISFEVKNLSFNFKNDKIVIDEDVIITFTAGEDYKLPETIVITIDGVEYMVYAGEEDSNKNPDGIAFDAETGTLTISKDLLEEAKAITITAEGIKKEDDESEEENSETNSKDESKDKENETGGGETADKEPENGTDAPATEDETETEDKTGSEDGETTDTNTPETNPDNNTEDEDAGESESAEPDTESTTPTEPDTEDNADSEQGSDSEATDKNSEVESENRKEETTEPTPNTQIGDDSKATTPTEPTTHVTPCEPAVTPDISRTEESGTNEAATDINDGDTNSGTTNTDNISEANSCNSVNNSTQNDSTSKITTSSSPMIVPTGPITLAPVASETNTPSTSTQTSINMSSTPISSSTAPSTNGDSSKASQSLGTTTFSGSKKTSSKE